jgi:hypothetical protein
MRTRRKNKKTRMSSSLLTEFENQLRSPKVRVVALSSNHMSSYSPDMALDKRFVGYGQVQACIHVTLSAHPGIKIKKDAPTILALV